VDGEKFGPDKIRFTVGNRTYSMEELGKEEKARWPFGEPATLTILKPGGRLAIITFHSLEDRIVKEFGRARASCYTCAGEVDVPELRQPRTPEAKWVMRKALTPGAAERAANPRSRSARLRVLEKL